jgi:hypothetical protein
MYDNKLKHATRIVPQMHGSRKGWFSLIFSRTNMMLYYVFGTVKQLTYQCHGPSTNWSSETTKQLHSNIVNVILIHHRVVVHFISIAITIIIIIIIIIVVVIIFICIVIIIFGNTTLYMHISIMYN